MRAARRSLSFSFHSLPVLPRNWKRNPLPEKVTCRSCSVVKP